MTDTHSRHSVRWILSWMFALAPWGAAALCVYAAVSILRAPPGDVSVFSLKYREIIPSIERIGSPWGAIEIGYGRGEFESAVVLRWASDDKWFALPNDEPNARPSSPLTLPPAIQPAPFPASMPSTQPAAPVDLELLKRMTSYPGDWLRSSVKQKDEDASSEQRGVFARFIDELAGFVPNWIARFEHRSTIFGAGPRTGFRNYLRINLNTLLLICLLAIYPFFFAVFLSYRFGVRVGRRKVLRCPKCRYNLLNCPSDRCPECGRPVDYRIRSADSHDADHTA